MKMTIIGGGSIFTPMLVNGLPTFQDELPITKVALLDIDKEGVERIGQFSRRVLERAEGSHIEVVPTTDRKTAIEDSSFVVFTIRVGGLQARILDETIPRKHGFVGDETTGAGGFANALRTIPVMVDYARDIERWAPDAWVIPFSNPEGLLTEALTRNCSVRVIGLCTGPFRLWKDLAGYFGVERRQVFLDLVGLTHVGWVRKILVDGVDRLPAILAEARQKGIGGGIYSLELIENLRTVPTYWLYSLLGHTAPHWFYQRERIFKAQVASEKTRGAVLLEKQQEVTQELSAGNLTLEQLAEKRGHEVVDEPILSLMSAIHNSKNEVHIVDVPNNGALQYFDPQAVVEMPALINRAGAHPLVIGDLSQDIRGLMQMVKAYEDLTIQAALSGSRELALKALLTHPLVMSYDEAIPLLDDLLKAHQAYLPKFRIH